MLEDIPPQVLCLGISGEKALKDEFVPFVRRDYNPMSSNEWWGADNHTCGGLTRGPDGNKHRLYLTAFIDARSGIFTGWHVTETPSAYAVSYTHLDVYKRQGYTEHRVRFRCG